MESSLHSAVAGRRLLATLLLSSALALGAAGCETEIGQDGGSDPETPPPPAATTDKGPAPTTYTLRNGGKVLVDSTGKRSQVGPKLVTGYVDAAVLNGEYVDMSGWAAPADLSRPADAIVAIANGKSVVVVKPSRDREDLVEGYDRPGLAKAGFAMSIPRSSLDCAAPDQGLQTFGVSGDVAGPLQWLADVPGRVAEAC